MKTRYEKGSRKAIITESSYVCYGKYIVNYYYNSELDFCNNGLSCKIFDTLNKAQSNARYYINK